MRSLAATERRRFAELRRDNRAIEGLPVRLVIALVVGVASLSVMLNMVSGVEGLAVSELDVRPSPEVTTPGEQELALTVVDPDGRPVAGATVVVAGDTARLDGVATGRTGANGTATVTVAPTLGPNREQGTLSVSIKPPAGGQYADRRGNTRVLVVAE
ncbi:Ig-like domain-containing protein [Halobaculum magnesiiphilum]|uniref:Ig-like domain-containing protein n=1 Tax=Halobaculum magnesiiphilum TaxID=1017351 RepID=A0A8T8WGZ2_9EURY|nr:Ig-like domain-containing protein [Halobaculum magnesiiphilum]QZP39121.1 Ig-like domain-containing protein [Halobaculum magnesiiphilum]